MKKTIFIIILFLFIAGTFFTLKMTGNLISNSEKAEIETNFGKITIELYPDKAPITVANFKKYVSEQFYDGTIFHRIIDGFMIQGGGYDSEMNERANYAPIKLESKNGLSNDRGTLAMARTNIPDSATSQFFINTNDNDFLNYGVRDEGYAVFGRVISGMDVVDKISKVKTDSNDFPQEEVKIISIRILNFKNPNI